MRAAVLVLADRTPRGLAALAGYFAPSDCDLYVHVDGRVDLDAYLAAAGPLAPNVWLLGDRRKVYWAGFSMVEATLDMLRAAHDRGPYDRYVFINDNSLPARPLDRLLAYLSDADDLMTCIPVAVDGDTASLYREYHLSDSDNFDWRRAPGSPRPLGAAELDQIAALLASRARGKKPFAVWHGHANWVLTQDSVRLVLETADNDPWLMESCRFSSHTDEFFFQSIVAAAKFPAGRHNGPMYCDTFRFSPRIIRACGDLPFDLHPHFLFLRKVAPNFDPDVPETCLTLYAGLAKILHGDAGYAAQRVLAHAQGEVRHLHLFAPAGAEPDWWPSRGNMWGRPFRWTQAETCRWRLRRPVETPHVRLTLPCVARGTDPLIADAWFEIDGRRAPLTIADVGYSAELRDLAAPFDEVALRVRPGGGKGFAVAILPEE